MSIRMKTKQAAEYCGSTESTFEKRRLTGDGPRFIKMGRSVVYDIRDLDSWLEQRKYSSTSEVMRG